mgnify:CR=1 FL=1
MTDTLVDTNIFLDLSGDDHRWADWSQRALAAAIDSGTLVINQVIYGELGAGFSALDDLEAALRDWPFRRENLPWDAAFLAGQTYVAYRRRGGTRTAPLPDFFIGAHAATRGYRLLTRDRGIYAAYFPTLDIISPERP